MRWRRVWIEINRPSQRLDGRSDFSALLADCGHEQVRVWVELITSQGEFAEMTGFVELPLVTTP